MVLHMRSVMVIFMFMRLWRRVITSVNSSPAHKQVSMLATSLTLILGHICNFSTPHFPSWTVDWNSVFGSSHSFCTALHCTVLHCTVLHCTTQHSTVPYCTALHCTALHCTALHCTALHYNRWGSNSISRSVLPLLNSLLTVMIEKRCLSFPHLHHTV